MAELTPLSPEMEEDLISSLADMAPVSSLKMAEDVIAPFEGTPIPDFIKHLHARTGVASFHSGRLLLCSPALLAPVLLQVFKGDPDFKPERTLAYAYSWMGQILAWSEDHWSVEIDLIDGVVTCADFFQPERKRNPETAAMMHISGFEAEDLDLEDDADKMVFSRIKRKLGALDYGECYGFFPALPLGGSVSVENARRVSAREHFAVLVGLQEFRLRDTIARPNRDVRIIGQ